MPWEISPKKSAILFLYWNKHFERSLFWNSPAAASDRCIVARSSTQCAESGSKFGPAAHLWSSCILPVPAWPTSLVSRACAPCREPHLSGPGFESDLWPSAACLTLFPVSCLSSADLSNKAIKQMSAVIQLFCWLLNVSIKYWIQNAWKQTHEFKDRRAESD